MAILDIDKGLLGFLIRFLLQHFPLAKKTLLWKGFPLGKLLQPEAMKRAQGEEMDTETLVAGL